MTGGALPTLVVIGAMKCGTTALHDLLDRHPDVAMSRPKELNYFFGPDRSDGPASWTTGNRSRGLAWYTGHFPAGVPVRGESSPGYTSPDHPHVAARMAQVVPDVRLVYLVRDPLVRALSQYEHHRAEGTERRPPAAALPDPASQYVARSRYHARLQPFLAHFPPGQVAVVAQEDLRDDPAATLRRVVVFAGADPDRQPPAPPAPPCRGDRLSRLSPDLRAHLTSLLRDDAARLRRMTGQALAGWSV